MFEIRYKNKFVLCWKNRILPQKMQGGIFKNTPLFDTKKRMTMSMKLNGMLSHDSVSWEVHLSNFTYGFGDILFAFGQEPRDNEVARYKGELNRECGLAYDYPGQHFGSLYYLEAFFNQNSLDW